jgi:hypothetical protein
MNEKPRIGPLELVVFILVAVVVGLLCSNGSDNMKLCDTPVPASCPTRSPIVSDR